MRAEPAVLLEYSDKDHRYFADGREMPSVTQILDRAGMVSEFCRDAEAAWRGSEVHRLCAEDDLALDALDLRKVDKRFRGYLRAWRTYRKDSGFAPSLIEHRIDEPSLGYAGRLDRVGVFDGYEGTVLLDIKTSASGFIADYVRYQLVAYAHALVPNKPVFRVAVALMPTGKYRAKSFSREDFGSDLAKWMQIVKAVKEEKVNAV